MRSLSDIPKPLAGRAVVLFFVLLNVVAAGLIYALFAVTVALNPLLDATTLYIAFLAIRALNRPRR
jgi:hypothetical protein